MMGGCKMVCLTFVDEQAPVEVFTLDRLKKSHFFTKKPPFGRIVRVSLLD
jgi:hypothetical protein